MSSSKLLNGLLIFAAVCIAIPIVFQFVHPFTYEKDLTKWNTYTDKQYGFSFKYPPDYKVGLSEEKKPSGQVLEEVDVFYPSGKVLMAFTNYPDAVNLVENGTNPGYVTSSRGGGNNFMTRIASQDWVVLPARQSSYSSSLPLMTDIFNTLKLPN